MNDIFKDLKKDISNEKDSDSGGSDSDPFDDDLDEKDLNKLHGNILYIIENFNRSNKQ
jgi:hypothetical protein